MSNPGHEAWQVREQDYPAAAAWRERLAFLVRYALLAPSGHNTQPWLFRVRDEAVELYADRTRALAVADPDDRELTISCGAALFHVRLALRRFGHRGECLLFPDPEDPDLLARVRPGRDGVPSEDERAMFAAIPERRTNRRAFEQRPLPDPLLAALSAAASAEGAWLYIARGDDQRAAVADLVAEGDRVQGADRLFRREMSAWTHPTRARSRDGLPGFAYSVGDMTAQAGPSILRTFEAAPGQAAQGRQLAFGSPCLAVLGTRDDAPASWLVAGQALARVLLKARTEGVHASYLNQPVELDSLRAQLKARLSLSGPPQLVLRLGYGPAVPPTPRRPLEDVLIP